MCRTDGGGHSADTPLKSVQSKLGDSSTTSQIMLCEVVVMDSIADAMVYAAAYISCRGESEDTGENDDSALEHVMAYLSHATLEEADALAAAAGRALREEQSLNHPNQEMVDFFESWMEFMLGRGWNGNRRA